VHRWRRVRYNAAGLIPAIVQDARQVLRWRGECQTQRTLELGETVFWSRSRQNSGTRRHQRQRAEVVAVHLVVMATLLIEVSRPAPRVSQERSLFFR
jgi:phosphoribosyl-AMP cyclohydrolase